LFAKCQIEAEALIKFLNSKEEFKRHKSVFMEEFKNAKGEKMENSISVEYFKGKSYLPTFY